MVSKTNVLSICSVLLLQSKTSPARSSQNYQLLMVLNMVKVIWCTFGLVIQLHIVVIFCRCWWNNSSARDRSQLALDLTSFDQQ